MGKYNFENRHIGLNEVDSNLMLNNIEVESIDELINQTIPKNIRLAGELNLPDSLTETRFIEHIQAIAEKIKIIALILEWGILLVIHQP